MRTLQGRAGNIWSWPWTRSKGHAVGFGKETSTPKSPTTFLSRIKYVTTLSMFRNLDRGVKREKFADYAARMVKPGGQVGCLPLDMRDNCRIEVLQ